ncbi:MAG: hypothetical protein ABR889_10665 [Acidobacteriaceae bacterium]|jgi:hypothetical protein
MTTKFNSIPLMHNESRCVGAARFMAAAASALMLCLAVAPDTLAQTPTTIMMRAIPVRAKRGDNSTPLPPLTPADVAQIKIGGKIAPVISFTPLLKGPHVLQLMVLLDSNQMLGANGQFDELKTFLSSLPSNVEIGLGWLLQGQVKVVQDFTTDRDQVYKKLIPQTREQAANPKNDNGNPFACLRYLASHWPDADPAKLRAVLMFSDGIIRSNSEVGGNMINSDASDAALKLERGSIVPYPFFWRDPIPAIPSPSQTALGTALGGQDVLSQVVNDASGAALYDGLFAPASLTPLLRKLYSILDSESVVTVNAPDKPGKIATLDIKSARDDIKISVPEQVMTGNVPVK